MRAVGADDDEKRRCRRPQKQRRVATGVRDGEFERHVDWTGRLTRAPLFVLPRSGKRWSHGAFYKRWAKARAGITDASLYQGTKHSFASDALEAGIGMEHIRKMLGHSDPRSTERYARLSDDSLNVFADSDRKRR